MKGHKKKSRSVPKSWPVSILSVLCMLCMTLTVFQWHASLPRPSFSSSATPAISAERRELLAWDFDDDIINLQDATLDDDDTTRDQVCKEYLMNFLNGTTDAKDECEGMLNAYQAAECAGDDIPLPGSMSLFAIDRRRHHSPNGTITQDDVLIDDFVENWECCSSIYEYYIYHCREPQLASFQVLGVVSVLVVCGLVKSLLKTFQIAFVPDAAACILVGATVGGILRLIHPELIDDKLSFFDNDLFLRILLPPIVFQSALTIDKRAFQRDVFPILTFAIVGTFLSAILVGYMVHWMTSVTPGTTFPLLDSLLFGSLISSIDPVATLGILGSVGVGKTDTLYTLIFGESLLNDGVAIVVFDTLVGNLYDGAVVDHHTLHQSVLKFFQITAGSVGIGILSGIVCTCYFWLLRRKHTSVVEVGIFFCWALIPYYISDGVGFSGIIAIMATGFFLDFFVIGGCQSEEEQWMDYMEFRYRASGPTSSVSRWFHPVQFAKDFCKAFGGRGHLSSKSRRHVGFVAEVIASIMETAIFAYLGLFLFNNKNVWDFRLNTAAIVACISSRAAVVVGMSVLVNCFVCLDLQGRLSRCFSSLTRRAETGDDDDDDATSMGSTARVYLSNRTQRIIFLSGVRGAVSFALVENVPVYDAVRKQGSHFKAEMKAMTSCSILFTVFVFGALTYILIDRERNNVNRGSLGGPLARRLLSAPLLSDEERSDGGESDLDSSAGA